MDMNKRRIQACGGLIDRLVDCAQVRDAVLLGENALAKNRKWWQLGPTVLMLPVLYVLLFPSLSVASQVGDSGATLISQSTVQKERRIALVIGNSDYPNEEKLKNPTNDANAIAKALSSLGFEVILKTNLNQWQMEGNTRQFNQQLRQGVVGLFYFAGHGIQVDGENYLISIGPKIDYKSDVFNRAIPLGKILDAMEKANNSFNIVMIDACRKTAFSRSWRAYDVRGLAPIDARGTLISFATSPNETASDGNGDDNSPYTSSVLKYIQTPRLSIESMFKQVRWEVAEKTRKNQIPWDHSSFIGEFSFNPGDASSTPFSYKPPTLAPIPFSPKPIDPQPPDDFEPEPLDSVKSETAALEFFNKGQKKSHDYTDQARREAILAYDQAIKLKPDYAAAYYYRGEVKKYSDYNGALTDYSMAIKYNPDYGLAYKGRGDIRPNLMSRDNQGALIDLDQAIKLLQLNTDQESKQALPETYHRRGKVRMTTGDIQGAIADFGEMIKLNKAASDWAEADFDHSEYQYLLRADAYLKLGNFSAAILDYDEIIKQSPDYLSDSYYRRGIAHESLGHTQNAIADFQKAAEIYRKNHDAEGYQAAATQLKKFNITVPKYTIRITG
jgi:tetratricopeptide (TPR) repeat protein